jgi:hypothetical protein
MKTTKILYMALLIIFFYTADSFHITDGLIRTDVAGEQKII